MSEAHSDLTTQERRHTEMQNSYRTSAYAARDLKSDLAPLTIKRRMPQPGDVQVDILYCGVCHSDLHQVRDQWHEGMPK